MPKIKVRVERKFRNKRSKQVHQIGDILEVTERRLKEIQGKDASLVSIVSDQPEDIASDQPEDITPDEPEE